MKIIEKIEKAITDKTPFYSFEYFPPKTEAGVQNLYSRLDRMAALEPAFVDVTWGAGGRTSELTLEISSNAQKYCGLEVMMHLTCTNMPREKIDEALETAKEIGISNILALRGDPPEGEEWKQCQNGFGYASDLVTYIREKYGDYFGICVAGYPKGHVEQPDKQLDIKFLKLKVDSGADFIITQLFYDVEEYLEFIANCRAAGITCPIIPGMLPIQNYERFLRIARLSQTTIPPKILQDLEPIKDDDAAVRDYGIQLCAEMCRTLLENGCPGLHFYTLNLERSVIKILQKLELVSDVASRRALPWRPSTLPQRRQEDVRPIFWSNRPKSYLARTMDWDEFPNGRWGDSRSPAFGDLNEYYLIHHGAEIQARKENRVNLWGENPQTEKDIFAVFANFCHGKIKRLPWCETPIREETGLIANPLIQLNENGFLTINSQPQINGSPSSDPAVGWGGSGGYVYQKAYVEFFVAFDQLKKLLDVIEQYPTLTYQAVNVEGKTYSNVGDKYVNALTWGVFPGKEIIQPTVADNESFMIWKDEAFDLWLSEWACLYPKESDCYQLIKNIHDNYYLVNLVENNYIEGDIFKIFSTICP